MEMTRPQRPEYYPGEFDTDDFSDIVPAGQPTPRPIDHAAEREAARLQVAGRRREAQARADQGIATSADIAILTETTDQETAMDTTTDHDDADGYDREFIDGDGYGSAPLTGEAKAEFDRWIATGDCRPQGAVTP